LRRAGVGQCRRGLAPGHDMLVNVRRATATGRTTTTLLLAHGHDDHDGNCDNDEGGYRNTNHRTAERIR
jgi:hypothetical protein